MKKTCHAKSVIKAGWRKLSGLMRLAVLGAVVGLCAAAVFSTAGGKAQNGTKLAGNDLRSSLEQFFGLI